MVVCLHAYVCVYDNFKDVMYEETDCFDTKLFYYIQNYVMPYLLDWLGMHMSIIYDYNHSVNKYT